MTDQNRSESIPATSMELTEYNLEQLKALFPNVFTEGKVDFAALKAELGVHVETADERYQFTWAGKQQAKRIATTPSLGTLRPAAQESLDWDCTENLYLEGDNLEVLKLLQKSYFGKIKMIYIDPPYNTGKDFVYKDNFRDSIESYKRLTGQYNEKGELVTTYLEGDGRLHSRWLSMMYPRLKLARNLLTNDGVIMIHISRHEVFNLVKVCDEIFGEGNSLGVAVWDKGNPKGDANALAYQHENIVMYAKNFDHFKATSSFVRDKKNAEKMLKKASALYGNIGKTIIPEDIVECVNKLGLKAVPQEYSTSYSLEDANRDFQSWLRKQDFSNGEKAYRFIDDNGEVYRGVSMAWPNKKRAPEEYFRPLVHPLTLRECPVPDRGWRNPPETMERLLKEGRILFGQDETKQPERKYLLRENMEENIPSILYFGGSDDGLLSELGINFENPKPSAFARELIGYVCKEEGTVLDFFSGSSTTAHAVMQLNAEDGGNRKFIMVQIPEPTPDKSEARKAGYDSIAEIGKERIRRAAAKIRDEYPDVRADLGFKVLKLDSSNLKKWQPNPDNLAEDLLGAIDNIEAGRSSEDLLYEVLIKYGLPLTLPVAQQQVNDHTVYNVGKGALVACFDDHISLETVQAIIGLGSAEQPIQRIVFRDSSFADDIVKTNAIQRFKQAGIDDVLSI